MDPTAAPVDLTIGDKTYQAYPLRDIDHETMNKWVRREYMLRVKDSIIGDPELQRIALANTVSMVWQYADGLEVAMTVAGLHKLASLMCRTKELSLEDCRGSDMIALIFDAYRELHHQDSDQTQGEESEGN